MWVKNDIDIQKLIQHPLKKNYLGLKIISKSKILKDINENFDYEKNLDKKLYGVVDNDKLIPQLSLDILYLTKIPLNRT